MASLWTKTSFKNQQERALLARVRVTQRDRAELARDIIVELLERNRVGGGPNGRSLPGKPPAVDSGRLIGSIEVIERRRTFTEVGPNPEAFDDAFYPEFLEFGTRRMAARPFMRPAVKIARRQLSRRRPVPRGRFPINVIGRR